MVPEGLVSHNLHLDSSEEPVVVEKIFWIEMRSRDEALSIIVHVANNGIKERIQQQVRKLKTITYKRKEILIVPNLGLLPPGKM